MHMHQRFTFYAKDVDTKHTDFDWLFFTRRLARYSFG